MKKQSGLSLIELSIVLVIAASVSAGVLAYYNYSKESNNINESVKQIQVIASGVSQLSRNALTPIPSSDEDGIEALNNYVKAVAAIKGLDVSYNSSGLAFFKLHNGNTVGLWRKTTVGPNKYELEVYAKNASDCIRYATLNMGSLSYAPIEVGSSANMNESSKSVTDVTSATQVCKNVASQNVDMSKHSIAIRYKLQF